MKKNDSVKRLIILALGLIGLCVLTAFYAHDWFAYYYHHIAWKTHNRFNVNGHLLIGVKTISYCSFSFPILMEHLKSAI